MVFSLDFWTISIRRMSQVACWSARSKCSMSRCFESKRPWLLWLFLYCHVFHKNQIFHKNQSIPNTATKIWFSTTLPLRKWILSRQKSSSSARNPPWISCWFGGKWFPNPPHNCRNPPAVLETTNNRQPFQPTPRGWPAAAVCPESQSWNGSFGHPTLPPFGPRVKMLGTSSTSRFFFEWSTFGPQNHEKWKVLGHQYRGHNPQKWRFWVPLACSYWKKKRVKGNG